METEPTPRSADRLALLHAGRFDLAIVDDDVPTDLADRVRAIMALWPKGRVTVDTKPMQLLVHADVPEDVVYRITGMIFDNADFFPIAHPLIGVGSARDSIVGLDVPVHTGAHKYYQRESPNPKRLSMPIVVVPTDVPTTSGQELETELPSIAGDDPYLIQQLAAACRDLANRGALVHFRDHRLLSDCKKMGVIDLGRGHRRPTM